MILLVRGCRDVSEPQDLTLDIIEAGSSQAS
jgi:hypothetical protein